MRNLIVEEIFSGKAPLMHVKRTEREVMYGLRSAMDTAANLPYETGMNGQLCDVVDLLWEWERRIKELEDELYNKPNKS